MKFKVVDNRIICSRQDSTAKDDNVYRHVVEFDAHVDKVPPHVASRLTSGEVEELEQFMADRRRIRANPAERNMLEALPELLHEATEIIRSVDRLNKAMYEKLADSISDMQSALDNVKPSDEGQLTPVNNMRDSEAQKERLDVIRREL